jgi:hypothetical protein
MTILFIHLCRINLSTSCHHMLSRQNEKKIENPARFFNYSLSVQNNFATWFRNAMLTTRVALALFVADSRGFLSLTPFAKFALLGTAVAIICVSTYEYHVNRRRFNDLIPMKYRRDVLPYYTIFGVITSVALFELLMECLWANL